MAEKLMTIIEARMRCDFPECEMCRARRTILALAEALQRTNTAFRTLLSAKPLIEANLGLEKQIGALE